MTTTSVRTALQDVTRLLTYGTRTIETNGAKVRGACGQDQFIYASFDEVKDEHLVSLHQTARHGKNEVEHVRLVEEH